MDDRQHIDYYMPVGHGRCCRAGPLLPFETLHCIQQLAGPLLLALSLHCTGPLERVIHYTVV
jgi:hypothetical protein